MEKLQFVWDSTKAKSNERKHNVTFEEARTVFSDDNGILIYDEEHSEYEERFILLGLSYKMNVLVVVHCHKESSGEIRIISARKSTKRESIQYQRGVR